jgi:hypothetical protein
VAATAVEAAAAAASTTHTHMPHLPVAQAVLTVDLPDVFDPMPLMAEASPDAAMDNNQAAQTVEAVVTVVVETSQITSVEGAPAVAAVPAVTDVAPTGDIAPTDQDGPAPCDRQAATTVAPAPVEVLTASAVTVVKTPWSRPCRAACPFNHAHSPDPATTMPATPQLPGREAPVATVPAVPLTWAERARQGRTPSPAPVTSARSATG